MGGSVRRSRALSSHAGVRYALSWIAEDKFEAKKRSRPTEREVNTAVFLLRAKQMGLTLSELDELDEGTVMDMIIESGNDLCDDEYRQVATQEDFDSLGTAWTPIRLILQNKQKNQCVILPYILPGIL
jgi:hypothetical protein